MISHIDTLTVDSVPVAKQQILPADTIKYLGVLPDVFPKPKVAAADTLPKLNFIPYISKDSLRLTKYHSMREFAPGEEGIPLVKDPCSSDIIVSVVFIFTLISLFVFSRIRKFFNQRIHDFFVLHEPARKFFVQTVGDARGISLLILQTIVFSGILIFSYFIHTNKVLTAHVNPYLLLALYSSLCLLYFFFKWFTYSFLGWVFLDRKFVSVITESYSTLVCSFGFILYPFVLFTVFSQILPKNLITIGLCLILFAKILLLYKWLKFFSQKFVRLLLLILYFCALEIIPCILFCLCMIQMNNMLIINF